MFWIWKEEISPMGGFNRFESKVEIGHPLSARKRCVDPVINFDLEILEKNILQDSSLSSVQTFSSDDSNARLLESFENSGLFMTME